MRETRALLSSEAAEKPIFGFLSGIASLSFSMLILETVWIAFPEYDAQALFFNGLIVIFLIADSLFDLYIRFRSPPKTIAFRKLRAVFVLAIVSYAALSPFTGLAFPYMFAPHPINVAGTIAIVFESYVVFGIRSVLFSRTHLYSMLSHQGESENVMELFSANARMVFDAYDQARSLQRSTIALFVVATFLTITNGYLLGIPFFVAFWYFMTMLSLFGMFGIANSYLDEHRFFAHGIVAPPKFQRIRQDWSYITILICVAVALLIAADWSPLKPSDIAAFFAWIASWFGNPYTQDFKNIQDGMNHILAQQQQIPAIYESMAVEKPNPFWPVFFEILKWVAIVGVVGLALFFVVRPLLSKEFKLGASLAMFFSQLGEFLLGPFKALGAAIRKLLAWRPQKGIAKKTKQTTTTPQDYIKAILRSAAIGSRSKDRLGIRSLEIYSEFLDWLFSRNIRWTLSDTPYDISEIALNDFLRSADDPATEVPQTGGSVQSAIDAEGLKTRLFGIADILEKDLFSKERANTAELDRMNTLFVETKRLAQPKV